MRRQQILVVDDEVAIVKLLRANLEAYGYEVVTAPDGAEALDVVENELVDLVILDINMPRLDGFEVCRRLRENSQTPIIMLSAYAQEQDKVKCLNMGADDYITKPFCVSELAARVAAVLRRAQTSGLEPVPSSFTSGDLHVDFAARRVMVAGKEVKMTPTEFQLLQELVRRTGKVLTSSYLLNKVWGLEYGGEREYLRVFIGRLRNKLEGGNRRYIFTVPGVGYQFRTND